MSERRSIICNIICIIDLISDEEMCPIPVFGEDGDVTLKKCEICMKEISVSFPSFSRVLVV